MKRTLLSCAVGLLAMAATVRAAQVINISCEGTESTGGGNRQYQFTLKNVSAAQQSFTSWVMATDDTNINNYSNLLLPANWVWSLHVPTEPPPAMLTTGVKVAHGLVDNNATHVAAAEIWWQCNLPQPFTLNVNQTITFGFDNPNASEDVEWIVGAVGVSTNWASAVAGPLGTYTDGPIHSPVPEPATLSLLALGGLALIRRKK